MERDFVLSMKYISFKNQYQAFEDFHCLKRKLLHLINFYLKRIRFH